MSTNKIRYAFYHPTWRYATDERTTLLKNGTQVSAENYQVRMRNQIFCPECTTPLSRSPKDNEHLSNNARSHFKHRPSYQNVPCTLHSVWEVDKDSKIETDTTIAGNRSITIKSFLKGRPKSEEGSSQFDGNLQLIDSRLFPASLASHQKDELETHREFETVAALCDKLDQNYHTLVSLPDGKNPRKLCDILINVATVTKTTEEPALYYGVITSSSMAQTKSRMTKLECHPSVVDFYIKGKQSIQEDKGINDQTQNRIVIFWGRVVENGTGLAVKEPNWGEFSLLPQRYDVIFSDVL